MASPLYTQLVTLVKTYVGEQKAEGLVKRQLDHYGCKEETFASADLAKIKMSIQGAGTLYVTDPAKKQEFIAKLTALT